MECQARGSLPHHSQVVGGADATVIFLEHHFQESIHGIFNGPIPPHFRQQLLGQWGFAGNEVAGFDATMVFDYSAGVIVETVRGILGSLAGTFFHQQGMEVLLVLCNCQQIIAPLVSDRLGHRLLAHSPRGPP